MSEQDDFFALINQIRDQYPQIFALLNQPDILALGLQIVQARIDGHPWTSDQITAGLQATPWYQNTPQPARDWYIMLGTDPATATQLQGQRAQQILSWAHTNGLQMTQDEAGFIAGESLARGEDTSGWQRSIVSSPFYATLLQRSPGTQPAGTEVTAAARDMGVSLSPLTQLDWQTQIATGTTDINSFKAYLAEQAKSLYPSLAGFIDSGGTVRQYVDPYAQLASKELGMNPADFDLSDPKWSAPIQQIDPKTGDRTAMTLSQWQSTLRSDPKYGYDMTTGARDQAAQFATSLAQQFGALG